MSLLANLDNAHLLGTTSRLRVVPNDVFLRDSTNRAWLLRGVNLSGSCKFPKYPVPVPSHVRGNAFLKQPLTKNSKKDGKVDGGNSSGGNVPESGLNGIDGSNERSQRNERNDQRNEEIIQDDQFKSPEDSEISFVGRPFELEEADEHLARLRHWGFRMIRWVVTWEAVEHQGPGIYDHEFLEYTVSALLKAKEYGFKVMIDFHQDVWSRFSGGSGAPLWTFYAAGLDPCYFAATGAATVHNTLLDDEPLLRMAWLTNYYKLACASMFTLFYAGKILAPQCTFENGVNIQDYLQSHFLNAIQALVTKIHDCREGQGNESKNLLEDVVVIGYDSWNEPSCGWIGLKRLDELPEEHDMRQGDMPTPLQSLMLGEGLVVRDVDTYQLKLVGPVKVGSRTIDPSQHSTSHQQPVKAWLSPQLRGEYDSKYGIQRDPTFPKAGECLWAQHGVWSIKDRKVLQQDYFSVCPSKDSNPSNEPIDWVNNHWLPFARRVTDVIRKVHPSAIIFLEPPVYVPPPHLEGKLRLVDTKSNESTQEDNSLTNNMVYAPHHYDDLVLLTKRYLGWINIDILGLSRGRHKSLFGSIVFGKKNTENLFGNQIDSIQNECYERLGRRPVLIGETGLHFDVGVEEAYQCGNVINSGITDEGTWSLWLRKMKECFFGRSKQEATPAWERHQFQQAFDNILNGLEKTLAHYTLWNYTIENDEEYGDGWNGENLSIYSRNLSISGTTMLNNNSDDQIYHELDKGGRAIHQFCRPYPIVTVGVPLKMHFDRFQKTFQLWTQSSTSDQESTLESYAVSEIYIPRIHFREAKYCTVKVSDGTWEWNEEDQIIYWRYAKGDEHHWITVEFNNKDKI